MQEAATAGCVGGGSICIPIGKCGVCVCGGGAGWLPQLNIIGIYVCLLHYHYFFPGAGAFCTLINLCRNSTYILNCKRHIYSAVQNLVVFEC